MVNSTTIIHFDYASIQAFLHRTEAIHTNQFTLTVEAPKNSTQLTTDKSTIYIETILNIQTNSYLPYGTSFSH